MLKISKDSKKKDQYRLPIEELYPNLTSEQKLEAEYFLNQYLEIIYRIYEENKDLTNSDLNTTV